MDPKKKQKKMKVKTKGGSQVPLKLQSDNMVHFNTMRVADITRSVSAKSSSKQSQNNSKKTADHPKENDTKKGDSSKSESSKSALQI